MTGAKKEGGFGFKELQTFNTTLLTKMAARILEEPNSLWVQVLKGIYFPNSDFMQANKGSRASCGWSSILTGRDVIKEDTVWTIGNGQAFCTFHDRWITISSDYKLHYDGQERGVAAEHRVAAGIQ